VFFGIRVVATQGLGHGTRRRGMKVTHQHTGKSPKRERRGSSAYLVHPHTGPAAEISGASPALIGYAGVDRSEGPPRGRD
jgi:hypothetical protein